MSILKKQEEKRKIKILQEQEKKFKELTKEELKYLINLIGRSDFKGNELQILYSVTAKLQNQLNS